MDGRSLIAFAALGLAACSGEPTAPAGNEAVPAANAASPTAGALANAASPPANSVSPAAGARGEVEATVVRVIAGDHLWANFEREEPALLDDMPVAAFLKAHEGQRVSVRIETVNRRLDPPGEQMDVRTVTAARKGGTTAQAWWDALPAARQQAAERGVWESGTGSEDPNG